MKDKERADIYEAALRRIAHEYADVETLRHVEAENVEILGFEEVLGMAYDNLQGEALAALRAAAR